MRLFCKLTIAVVVFYHCMGVLPASSAVTKSSSILVLNSYHHGYNWTDEINRGLGTVFQQELLSPSRQVEYLYMDTKRDNSAQMHAFLRQYYAMKFNDRHFDVIVATDNNALNFLLDHRDALFPGVPVVFCGINEFQPEQLRGHTGYTGVNETADMDATLALMLETHPQTKQLLIIEDDTTTSGAIKARLDTALSQLPSSIELIRPGNVSMADLLQMIANLPPDSLILLTLFFRDANDVYYEYNQSASLLSKTAQVPIYGLWDFYLGHGIVGGKLASGYYQGETAAQLAIQILKGAAVDQIPVVMQSPNHYMFDYQQLERFDIPRHKLPEDHSLVNPPDPRVQHAIQATLVIGTGSTVILLLMAHSTRLRNQHRRLLMETNRQLENRVAERTNELEIANQQLKQEIQSRKAAEEKIHDLAYHDPLTQLPNRNLFIDRFSQTMARAIRHDEKGYLMYLDLDGFKVINDRLGHQAGDHILCAVSQRLSAIIRKTDTLARWGGDEFLLLVPNETENITMAQIIERFRNAMVQPIDHNGGSIHVGISIGVAMYPEQGHHLEELITQADASMYSDKKKHKRKAATG